jgi:hypothetical protein
MFGMDLIYFAFVFALNEFKENDFFHARLSARELYRFILNKTEPGDFFILFSKSQNLFFAEIRTVPLVSCYLEEIYVAIL